MVNVEHETAPGALAFRDEEGNVNPTFLASVAEAIADGNAEELRRLAAPLHEADLGALIEALHYDDRPRLVALLGSDFDFAALTEVDDAIREDLLESIPNANIAEGVRELDVDDAVYILEDLDEADKAEVLEQLPPPERVALQRSLDYPEDSAGRRMQTEFIAVPPFWTVGQTIDYMRDTEDLPDTFYEIFVVDPSYQLIGTVPLDRLLRTKRPAKISDIMNEDQHLIEATDDQEKAARLFQRYNLVSCAVVDEARRLVGVMMVDDIVDVIEEEADEDLKALGGVKGDEELSDTIWYTVRSRFPWLFANLLTAIVAANVIHLFEGSIQQMVVLAVLMPIVASIGGNAGTQTMTVTVRALATQELRRSNTWRIIRREVAVGICNGVGFAIILGTVAVMWFGIRDLGFVIGLAILTVLSVAALGGILIPLTLNRLGVDPAVSSGPFVTTTTDVIGFFAFLGIATLWFGLS